MPYSAAALKRASTNGFAIRNHTRSTFCPTICASFSAWSTRPRSHRRRRQLDVPRSAGTRTRWNGSAGQEGTRSVASEGRNNAGLWLAIQLRDNGYSQIEAEAVALLYAACCPATNTKGHIEPYLPDEVRATVHEVYGRPAREAWGAKKAPKGRTQHQSRHETESHERAAEANTPAPDLLGYLHNDHGNACRLIALHGEDMRYCYPFKKWLTWDGQRWAVDATGHARRLAKETMLEFLRQAIHLGNPDAKGLPELSRRTADHEYAFNGRVRTSRAA